MIRSVRGGGCQSVKIISLTKLIRTSWLSIKNSLSLSLFLQAALTAAALLRKLAAKSNDQVMRYHPLGADKCTADAHLVLTPQQHYYPATIQLLQVLVSLAGSLSLLA